jgi:phosphatidylcholine synthase
VGETRRERPHRVALAWSAHLYTALGLVCAAAMAVLIVRAAPGDFRAAFALMLVATLIDATDGTYARAVHVKQVLPGFDGRRLDDLIDFLTYSFLPLLLLWRAGVLPADWAPWLLVPLGASAYGFCQSDIKTADGYFLGFPSLWNVVALYLYALPFPPGAVLAILLLFSLLTFLPTRYLYPSQRGRLNRWTNIFGGVWAALLVVVLRQLPDDRPTTVTPLAAASLAFPVYYLAASWWVSWQKAKGVRADPRRGDDAAAPRGEPLAD